MTASTAVVTVATLAAGIATVSFGLADVLEALQDLSYGLTGSRTASFNPLRDTLFAGNEDMYYGMEVAATQAASAGTITYYNYNMESEINAAKSAGYGINNTFGGDKETKTLYHYTKEKGMKGIVESKQLNPSLKENSPKDARYGDGQYLSDIRPDTQTLVSLAKKFINVPNQYKYTHYVEINVTGLEVIQGWEGVFVHPGNSPLDLTDRIISTGQVGFQ